MRLSVRIRTQNPPSDPTPNLFRCHDSGFTLFGVGRLILILVPFPLKRWAIIDRPAGT